MCPWSPSSTAKTSSGLYGPNACILGEREALSPPLSVHNEQDLVPRPTDRDIQQVMGLGTRSKKCYGFKSFGLAGAPKSKSRSGSRSSSSSKEKESLYVNKEGKEKEKEKDKDHRGDVEVPSNLLIFTEKYTV